MVPNGWSELRLSQLMSFKNGFNTEKERYGSGTKFVNVMDIFKNDRLFETNISASVQVTDSQLADNSVEYGDVLFNRTSEVPDEIAMSATYLDTKNKVIFGGFVIRGKPKTSDLTPEYSVYCFRTSRFRREAIRRSQGVIRSNIGQKDLDQISVLLPPRREQLAIADILSTWDQAIKTTGKLIENSKAQKKALMQQLLTGKKRYSQFIDSDEKRKTNYGDLPLDWLFLPISDIAFEQNERAGKNSELPVLSCSKHDGFVESLQYFKKKVYSDDTSNYKVVRRGCYGFPSNHIEEGSIGFQDICNVGLVSPIYSVFKTSERVHDGYLFRLMKTEHYRQIFQARTNASVDRRGSLRWKEFCKIHVPLPSLTEQQKIAGTIDAADNELANLSNQLIRLQAQKRALMQQLLTGKRRVKVAA